MRNTSGYQGKNERKRKKKLGSFWKFYVVIVQNNGKEMYKKSVLHVQRCFFLLIFFCCFRCRRRLVSITRVYILL